MFRNLMRRLEDERGIALITALLVSMIVVTLGATAVTLSLHNSEQSAFDRRRVESISAAEAGINYYFSHLQSGPPSTFECNISKTLQATPTAQFDASVTFYAEDGDVLPCPPTTEDPSSARIESVGTSTSDNPSRTMQAYVNLIPVLGTPFGEFAVFSETSPNFNSNTQIFGGDSNGGNVYTNGNAIIESNATIYGDVWAQGFVRVEGNAEVKEEVWAGTSVTLDSYARVRGDIRAATSFVSLAANAHAYEDVQAGTRITAADGIEDQIDGLAADDSPSDIPPTLDFPPFNYDQAAWVESGYSISPEFSSCTLAKAFIQAIVAGDWVVRITGACELNWNRDFPTIQGNLAIISNGGTTLRSNTAIDSDGGEHNLFLIFGLSGSSPCDIKFSSETSIATGLKTVLYTPCVLDMNSNSLVIDGQMFAGAVNFNSNMSLTYNPIGVPGFGTDTFDEDIVYIREIVTDD
jgi:Tfp pilus assembly protein PilX/cytoskeletal protein CcmA (bactofilin family)